MKSKRLSWATLMILALGVGLSRDAQALANRVFISARSGNDANACNNILTPCQTFAGAVLQLNPAGEAIVLDSGGYGAVTITKAMTIEAPPGVLAFVHPSSGDGITVNAGASDTVVLRGIVLNGGAGNGITVNTVGVLQVENCVISGFNADFVAGLNFVAPGGRLFVKDTIARNNWIGIAFTPSPGTGSASIDHCRLEKNVNDGLFVEVGKVTIRDSVASGNAEGLHTLSTIFGSGELNVENCLVANNSVDGILASGGIVRVSASTITDNITGLHQTGSGTLLSRLNNTVEGNGTNTSGTIGVFGAQ